VNVGRTLMVVLALLWFTGCASRAPIQGDARVAFAGDQEQYVVITVRNPATLLPRAGSTLRDYDATHSYGISPVARRELRALASAYRLREVDGWPIAPLGVHCVVFQLPSGVGMSDTLKQLQRDHRVESVQPLHSFSTLSTNSDPYRGLQRNHDTMQVARAHAWSRGDNVRVAIIDTGIDTRHPDLAGRLVTAKNFVDASARMPAEKHGTAIAGLIAAVDNNGEGIVGIAPAAKILGLKACWEPESASAAAVCNTFTLAKALVAAVEGKSDIVNLSLGGPADPLLERLVDYGIKRGVIYVGAASARERGFPCNVTGVICVGSAGELTDGPQLFAPGSEVLTLIPAGRYDFLSGSSLAAASVSGGIALLRARSRDLNVESALRLLAPVARDLQRDPTPSIDVCHALERLLEHTGCVH
jgi:hypothetical protein